MKGCFNTNQLQPAKHTVSELQPHLLSRCASFSGIAYVVCVHAQRLWFTHFRNTLPVLVVQGVLCMPSRPGGTRREEMDWEVHAERVTHVALK